MNKALTDKQREVLDWIRGYVSEWGYAPSLREIGDAFGLTSTNGVHDHLSALERKGYIRRTRNVARGLVLLDEVANG